MDGLYAYVGSGGTHNYTSGAYVLASPANSGTHNQTEAPDGAVNYYQGDVTSFSDYYPFGMQMPGRNGSMGDYRFGYNGQEKDDEVKGNGNSLSFKYRIYDPRLGKFLSEDPLTKSYPWYTPYQFAGNTPIWAKDLEGAEPEYGPENSTPTHVPTSLSELLQSFSEGLSWFTGTDIDDDEGVNSEEEFQQKLAENQRKRQQAALRVEKADQTMVTVLEVTAEGIGSVPVVDLAADPMLAAYYAEKGDYASAGAYSAAAAIPLASGLTTKYGSRLLLNIPFIGKYADDAYDFVTNWTIVGRADEIVKGVTVKLNGADVSIFRGGADFTLKPGEFKVTPNGKYPARGLSLNADASKVANYGGAKKITSVPNGLEIIHTPSNANPQHFDIIPRDRTISQEQFQSLLNQIKVE